MCEQDASVVGDVINFRGMIYAPVNEQGVVFLFGKVMEDLNMYVEEIKSGFPDCVARRFVGKGWKRVRVEFEFCSRNFRDHGHEPAGCDIIVCWDHNWSECPLEVLELREIINGLPARPVVRPGAGEGEAEQLSAEQWFEKHGGREGLHEVFRKMVEGLQEHNQEVFYNVGDTGISIYSPEHVMAYVWPRKTALRLEVFTGGEALGEATPLNSLGKRTKWGALRVKSEADLREVLPWLVESMRRIKAAIARNEPTGWLRPVEEPEEARDEGDEAEDTV